MYVKVETITKDLFGRLVWEDRISAKNYLSYILPSTNTQKIKFEKLG